MNASDHFLEEIVASVRTAVDNNDAADLESCTLRYLTEWEYDEFPDQLMSLVISLLSNERFLHMEGSWHLLHMLETEWDCLTESQKSSLLRAIHSAFPRLRDWLACFVVAELLGMYFCDASALSVLVDLGKTSKGMHRTYIPSGLKYIAESGPPSAAVAALAELRLLSRDPDCDVRREATECLRRLRQAN